LGKPKSRNDSSVVLFDVFYEDGTRASNRKVPAGEVGGLDGDAPALTWMMAQERKISELSGKPPREIKKLVRSGRS
jgi:hypothetical protein